MAGDRIKAMSIELAKRVSDEVSAYSTDGSLFTSVQRLRALNDARNKIYGGLYGAIGSEKFINEYPEFCVEIPLTGGVYPTVAANLGALPAGWRKFISVELIRVTTHAGIYLCRKIPIEVFHEMIVDSSASPYATSEAEYGYCNLGTNVRFFGEAGGTIAGTYTGIYLKDVADAAYTEDIPDPFIWQEGTIQEAAKILLSQASNN